MVLQLDNVTKKYKNGRGIENITFSLGKGDIFGLLGPNGSGKTTIMKAITGIVGINGGSVAVCGFDSRSQRERALSHTGSLIEAPALFDSMTAQQNLNIAAGYYKDVGGGRIAEVLEIVGMSKYAGERVQTFSLGMRQRIGLALALLSNPDLLILDEPANGLDIEGMVQIREIVKNAADGGAAVLISSHLAHEIEMCATRVGIMYDGRLLCDKALPSALESSPALEDFFLSEVAKIRSVS